MKKYVVSVSAVVLLLCFSPDLWASEQDSIDALEAQCAEFSQQEREICKENVLKMWGVEVNKAYKAYMAVLNQKERDLLRGAQIAWMKFRAAEINLVKSVVRAQQGSISKDLAMEYLISIDRNRALALRAFQQGLGGEGR